MPDARKWAIELEDSCEATSYELKLIGLCSDELSRGSRYGCVEVPSPQPLDIQGLIEQAAHRLAVYLEYQGKSAGKAITRVNVVDSLVGRLQRFSTEGKPVLRNDFEVLLDKWVQDALEKEERPSAEQLRVLKERLELQLEKLHYIRPLHIDHPDAILWRGSIERYMRALDQTLPGEDFEERRANIPWHEPNMRATDEDYKRGCDMMTGLLGDTLQKLQEELDMIQEGAA